MITFLFNFPFYQLHVKGTNIVYFSFFVPQKPVVTLTDFHYETKRLACGLI